MVFQLEVYYMVDSFTGLTAQQIGTTAPWYSNKTPLVYYLFLEIFENFSKGPPQLKKSLKFQLLTEIFWTPSPPLQKRALPTKTPVFLQKAEPHRFYQLRWPLRTRIFHDIVQNSFDTYLPYLIMT